MKAQVVKSYWDNEKLKYLHEGDIVDVTDERFKTLSTEENEAKTVLLKKTEKVAEEKEETKQKARTKASEKSE